MSGSSDEFLLADHFVGDERISREETLMRIEVLCLNMIRSIVNRHVPHIEMVSRNVANALLEGQTKRLGKKKTKRTLKNNPAGFARSAKVLSLTHELLCKQTFASLREAFYCLKDELLFQQQRPFDDTVNDVCAALQVSRFSLGLHATAKGLIVGRLKIKERDGWHDCAVSPYSISARCESLPVVENCGANLILVVEKHAAMLRLAEDRLWSKMPMILITAKGFPDMASRQFLCALVHNLNLPVYGLFDFNLGGFRVYDTWSRGSIRMGLEAWRFATKIAWVGLRAEDLAQLDLPMECFQNYSEKALRQLTALQQNLTGDERAEIEAMRRVGASVELEALYHFGPTFLSEWTLRKLLRVRSSERGTLAIV